MNIDKISKNLLNKKNVVAVAEGQKWIKGQNTHEPAVLVFVKQKENIDQLRPSDIIPKNIDGTITDVVGRSGEFMTQAFTARQRPVQGGISCGHLYVTAGTLGGFFLDRENKVVGLSNNHVLAAENRGIRGHLALQPGVYDNASWTNNRIGLLKYYRPLVRSNQVSFDAVNWKHINGYNLEDSATFEIDNPDIANPEIKGIGLLNNFRDTINIGEQVQKSGRTTEVTTGTVIGLNATVNVNFGTYSLEFRDQIITTGMSQGGDSGSLLLDTNKNVVGLLFAGSNTLTVHNRIIYPKATYGLSIYRTTQITEELEYILKIDGQITSNNYTAKDFEKATNDAKNLAREGHVVEITATFRTEPDE
jgi:hypothetical protein